MNKLYAWMYILHPNEVVENVNLCKYITLVFRGKAYTRSDSIYQQKNDHTSDLC